MIRTLTILVAAALCFQFVNSRTVLADPCGMVPPIYNGSDPPIVRTGLQKTYVFHKDGVETFVIRPGFSGKVDEFGMLIPFPSVPSLRKAPDNIFEQIANAIDPPEVVIDLRPRLVDKTADFEFDAFGVEEELEILKEDAVRVIKQEAVGMYEVAVLAAGSPKALKKWMQQNGFRYPAGMDKVTAEYIEDQWCFVAVKTKVAEKDGVDPKPGQRTVDSKMEKGSSFDGFVQAMGFRFKTDKLVVPMRLSTFNEGDLRNVVYVLTDSPQKIHNIPERYVVRQVSGDQLYKNVTGPLPLRIIGGTEKDLQDYHRVGLDEKRDPTPKNGLAKLLFAADLKAVASGELSLSHEEDEKELLQISEYFGLRGDEIDRQNAEVLAKQAEESTKSSLDSLRNMTLTVVDGDFPRDVLQRENLTFARYEMPADSNNDLKYDAKVYGAGSPKQGKLFETGMLDHPSKSRFAKLLPGGKMIVAISLLGVSMLFLCTVILRSKRKQSNCSN